MEEGSIGLAISSHVQQGDARAPSGTTSPMNAVLSWGQAYLLSLGSENAHRREQRRTLDGAR